MTADFFDAPADGFASLPNEPAYLLVPDLLSRLALLEEESVAHASRMREEEAKHLRRQHAVRSEHQGVMLWLLCEQQRILGKAELLRDLALLQTPYASAPETAGESAPDGRAAAPPRSPREALADYAHAAWSGWMAYMFSKAEPNEDGTWTMPAEFVERWQRQMNTLYPDLPEHEKVSDRVEAERILEVLARAEAETAGESAPPPTPEAPASVTNPAGAVKGYRPISQEQLALVNKGKDVAEQVGRYIELLRGTEGLDQRWVSIGATGLQQGFMAAFRGIMQPDSF